MYKYLSLLMIFCIITACCDDDDENGTGGEAEACEAIDRYVLSLNPNDGSIEVKTIDLYDPNLDENYCIPDVLEIYMSEDNVDFELIAELNSPDESYIVDGLVNDEFYFFKMISKCCEFVDTSSVSSIIPAALPNQATLGFNIPDVREFCISKDRQYIAYCTTEIGEKDCYYFHVDNPEDRIFFANNVANLNLLNNATAIVYSKFPSNGINHEITYHDLSNDSTNLLYDDFQSGLFNMSTHLSVDETHLYFKSNKYGTDNIWKVSLENGLAQMVTEWTDVVFPEDDFKGIYSFSKSPISDEQFYVRALNYIDPNDGSGFIFNPQFYAYNLGPNELVLIEGLEEEFANQNSYASVQDKIFGVNSEQSHLLFYSNLGNTGGALWTYEFVSNELKMIAKCGTDMPCISNQNSIWYNDDEVLVYQPDTDEFALISL